MKNKLVCMALLVVFAGAAFGQNGVKKAATDKKAVAVKSGRIQKKDSLPGTPVMVTSVSSYQAKSFLPSNISYTINDPLLKAFNEGAGGAGLYRLTGMPKRAYGFSNGRLVLFSSGSTSTGGTTGNGSVGTGSGMGAIGATGARMGINGKSPYAGLSMWGNARNMLITHGDSAVRDLSKKQ
jgi:hypothetical protein